MPGNGERRTQNGIEKTILDALPVPVFLVDDDLRVEACNLAAEALRGDAPTRLYHDRCGEILRCIHARNPAGGCGRAERCRTCAIRASVGEVFSGSASATKLARIYATEGVSRRRLSLKVTASPVEVDGSRRVVLTLQDFSLAADAQALLPICSFCKKVRDDQDYWTHIDAYLSEHHDMLFTHGICPDCARERTRDIEDD